MYNQIPWPSRDKGPYCKMSILYLLIPLGLVLLGVAVWAFMWAVRSGQFEDLEGPAHRILMDDDELPTIRPSSKPDQDEGSQNQKNGSDETLQGRDQ